MLPRCIPCRRRCWRPLRRTTSRGLACGWLLWALPLLATGHACYARPCGLASPGRWRWVAGACSHNRLPAVAAEEPRQQRLLHPFRRQLIPPSASLQALADAISGQFDWTVLPAPSTDGGVRVGGWACSMQNKARFSGTILPRPGSSLPPTCACASASAAWQRTMPHPPATAAPLPLQPLVFSAVEAGAQLQWREQAQHNLELMVAASPMAVIAT